MDDGATGSVEVPRPDQSINERLLEEAQANADDLTSLLELGRQVVSGDIEFDPENLQHRVAADVAWVIRAIELAGQADKSPTEVAGALAQYADQLGVMPDIWISRLVRDLRSSDPNVAIDAARQIAELQQNHIDLVAGVFDEQEIARAGLLLEVSPEQAAELPPLDPPSFVRVADEMLAANILDFVVGQTAPSGAPDTLADRPGENPSPVHFPATDTPLRDRLIDILMESVVARAALETSPVAHAIGKREALGLMLDITPILSGVLAVDDLQYTEQGLDSALGLVNVTLSAVPGGFSLVSGIARGLGLRATRTLARDAINQTLPAPRLVQLGDEGVETAMTSEARRLANEAGGAFASLTDDQAHALHVYTRRALDPFTLNSERVAVSIHSELNGAMRSPDDLPEHLLGFAEDLETALLRLPMTGDGTFHRVAQFDEALIDKIRLEGTFSDPAFMSASLIEERALTYSGNVYMEIEGSSARYFSPMAFNPLDEEVLFLPKTRFTVTEFVQGGGPEGRLLIKLREVSE